MDTEDNLNTELRKWVILRVLLLERHTKDALKYILRMLKSDSKTLDNRGTTLSFKSRVDLLYDLGEIEKKEYNQLIKIMEIRNQFVHNSEVASFEALDNINTDINKFLLKDFKTINSENQSRESDLKESFDNFFYNTSTRLHVICLEYLKGIRKDYEKLIDHNVMQNIKSVWKDALDINKKRKAGIQTLSLNKLMNNDLDGFDNDFNLAVSNEKIRLCELMPEDDLELIKGKVTIKDYVLEREQNKDLKKD